MVSEVTQKLLENSVPIVKAKTIIEIKPKAFTIKPRPRKRRTRAYVNESLAYIKNKCKWGAAKRYCDMQGWQFKIFTEDDLGKFN